MQASKNVFISRRAGIAPLLVPSIVVLSIPANAATEIVHEIKLPAETAVLRPSELPGYTIALQKCGICHSADYINLQSPHMSLTQWTAEMTKMQHSYGAPIDETEIKLLGVYLTTTYGDATTVSAGAAAAPVAPTTPRAGDSTEIDVQAVLAHNACLGCHALQEKAVGPAYHDVATKYKSDPNAPATLEANIRAGGSGKWGAVNMPTFPNLSPTEAQALAKFVLAQ